MGVVCFGRFVATPQPVASPLNPSIVKGWGPNGSGQFKEVSDQLGKRREEGGWTGITRVLVDGKIAEIAVEYIYS